MNSEDGKTGRRKGTDRRHSPRNPRSTRTHSQSAGRMSSLALFMALSRPQGDAISELHFPVGSTTTSATKEVMSTLTIQLPKSLSSQVFRRATCRISTSLLCSPRSSIPVWRPITHRWSRAKCGVSSRPSSGGAAGGRQPWLVVLFEAGQIPDHSILDAGEGFR